LRKGRHGAALAVDAAKGPGTPSCRFRSGSPPRGALALPARQSGAPGPFSLTLACSSAQPRLLRGRPSRRGAVAFGKARPSAALPGEAVPPGGRFASRTMARPSLPCAKPVPPGRCCLRQSVPLHRLAWRGPCRRGGCDWMGATRRWVGARGTE
jgi:hypothetical protein